MVVNRFEFVFVAFLAILRGHRGCFQPSVDCTANLFHGQPAPVTAGRNILHGHAASRFLGIILQSHPGAEQVTQLCEVEMAVKATPSPDLVMVHS